MRTNEFQMEEILKIGNKLADAGLIARYAPRGHSHNCMTLFPQTPAQYRWLKRKYGLTDNVLILEPASAVLAICPELEGYVSQTKSGRMCRIRIRL